MGDIVLRVENISEMGHGVFDLDQRGQLEMT
jgi:hypothetical protein